MKIYSGYVPRPPMPMSTPTMLLAVCQTEKITIKARQIAKLSIYLLMEPSLSLFLALEIKSKEAMPNMTVVMPTTTKFTINLHLQYQLLRQRIVSARPIRQPQFPFQALLLCLLPSIPAFWQSKNEQIFPFISE